MEKGNNKSRPMRLEELNGLVMTQGLSIAVFGYIFSRISGFLGIFINEFLFIFLLPYFIFRNRGLIYDIRVEKIKKKTYGDVTRTILLFYPIFILLSFNRPDSGFEIFNAEGFGLKEYFFIALLPAFCEEWFFRHQALRLYERYFGSYGKFFIAIIFGLMHFNLNNLLGPLVLSLILSYFYEKHKNFYLIIYAHLLNNSLGFLVIKYFKSIMTFLSNRSFVLMIFIILYLYLLFRALYLEKEKKKLSYGDLFKNISDTIKEAIDDSSRISLNSDKTFERFMPILVLVCIYVLRVRM